jgi:hypothetical protein
MKIRRVGAVVTVLGVLLHGAVAGRAENKTTPPPPTTPQGKPTPPPQTTAVKGDIPEDIVGRWLFVAQIQPRGPVVLPRLVEIRKGANGLEVIWGPGELPKGLQEKCTVERGNTWVPTQAELDDLARRWNDVDPTVKDHVKIENQLVVADQYPAEFKSEPMLEGTAFAIVGRESFAGVRRVSSTFTVFGVKERTPGRLSGPMVTVSVALGMFPIPITVKGDYVAYPVPPAPDPTVWERLMAIFRGCGRGRSAD